MPAVRQYDASPIGEHVFLTDFTQVLIDAPGRGGGRSFSRAFASGTLPDEVYALDLSSERIVISPEMPSVKYRKE
jgi:hypothetical protein